MDNIVPFTMKTERRDVDGSHLILGNFSSCCILATIQAACNLQPFRGGRACDQTHDGLIIAQRFTTPVGRNEREEAMFHFVPLAGPGRKVAHDNRQTCLVCQALQLPFPQTQPVSIAATSVSGDEQPVGRGIQPVSFTPPPAANGGDCKGSGVVIGSYTHKSSVPSQIIDAVGISPRYRRTRKIVPVDSVRSFRSAPLAPFVFKVADELLFL